ncbi:MAG: hypothetical protein Ct9H300mP11_32720 [Chloroflexota bacterium]|nr:MAG: hypothetical protein Ct9H300mP11_32720 [Chloroflexota bacterium]
MQAGLPPELNALKNTVRQIVKDECYPLETTFLPQSISRGSRGAWRSERNRRGSFRPARGTARRVRGIV